MTNTTEHTPAPWHIDWEQWTTCGELVIRMHSDTAIAELIDETGEDWNAREAEMLSNARLIAAAPELLEALEQAIPWLERLGDFIGNGGRDASNPESLGARCDTILKAKKAIAKAKTAD